MTSKRSSQWWLRVMPSLFELVYSGENAFCITVTNFYTIDFTRSPQIQSILGFESSVLEKGLDNPRRYFLSIVYNQVVVTNDTVRHVLSISTDYYGSSGVHRGCGQWDSERASPFIDNDWERVCEIHCPRRRVILWSWKWRHNNRWMVMVGLHGSNCLHPHTTCVWSVP